MDVNYQSLFNIAVTVLMGMGGWILGRITHALDKLDEDVRNLPHKYVSKEDYKTDLQDIKHSLDKIFDKLDGKADK